MYQKILVPVDGSVTSLQGLQEAIKLAKALGAKLRLLHVVNELIIDSGYGTIGYQQDVIDSLREGGKKTLAAAESTVRKADIQCETDLQEVFGQRAADVIIATASSSKCELIVMGTHGRRGLRRLAMGSDAELVIRGAPVPVLLVRDATNP
jgi:nucleotide-binding universal stress UspA family protein